MTSKKPETPIRTWRLDHRQTLEEFAAKVGISVAQLCRIELGRVTPTVETARKLSSATGLSLDEVLRQ